ncbi:MAG: response regulator [Lachnospiraceae bacterium]|nr:response regulator [Lachnospiraceae bacterium]
MKKVLLIGRFNSFFEEMNHFLSGYFNVQMCVDNLGFIKGMLKMNRPDIIVVSLIEVEQHKDVILNEIREKCANIPILCMGAQNDMIRFAKTLAMNNVHKMVTPVDNEKVLECIYELLHIDYNVNNRIIKRQTGERKCIMLIDDSPMQLRVLNEILKSDYDVQMATSGAKALAMLGQRLPDIIFLDYDMPECDGRMTLQMIREIEEAENIPVIFLTGVNDSAHIRAVLDLHPAGYMLKPANSTMLKEVLNKYLK